MKIEWNKKYTTIAVYAVIVVTICILIYQLLQNFHVVGSVIASIWTLLLPFIYGIVLAYIFLPVLRLFEQKILPWISRGKLSSYARRTISIALTMACFLCMLILFFAIIIPELMTSLQSLGGLISDYVPVLEQDMKELLNRYRDNVIILSLINAISGKFEGIMQSLVDLITQSLSSVINATIDVTATVVKMGIGVVITVYLWASKETFYAQIKKILYAVFNESFVKRLIRLAHDSNKVFSGFVTGKVIDSLIVGIICFIGMSIFGMQYALLISVIVGVTNIIPYFGPFIGAVPSALLLLLVSPMQAFWFLVFVLVLQQIDGNLLSPKILGSSTGLSAFWVMFSVIVFGGAFGFVGLLVSVPVFAVLYTLIKRATENRLEKKGYPVATRAYANEENPIVHRPKKKNKKMVRKEEQK